MFTRFAEKTTKLSITMSRRDSSEKSVLRSSRNCCQKCNFITDSIKILTGQFIIFYKFISFDQVIKVNSEIKSLYQPTCICLKGQNSVLMKACVSTEGVCGTSAINYGIGVNFLFLLLVVQFLQCYKKMAHTVLSLTLMT